MFLLYMMLKNKKILCHEIDEITLNLLNNIKNDFPNTKIMIHPLCFFEKETGLTYNYGDLGVYLHLTNFIAIYVKQDLNNELFNIALSHELLHHYQIMRDINIIYNVNQFCKEKLPNFKSIIENIYKSMMDVEIYYKQKQLGYDLTPLSKYLIDSHIEDLLNTEVDINLQNNISWYFMAFYKCWFISEYLYALDDLMFKNDIIKFYENNLSDENWIIWKSLLSLTKAYPPDSNHNYDIMLKQICSRLLKCTAYLKKINPPMRTIKLMLFDLIPACVNYL